MYYFGIVNLKNSQALGALLSDPLASCGWEICPLPPDSHLDSMARECAKPYSH